MLTWFTASRHPSFLLLSQSTAACQGVAAALQACVSLATYVLPVAAADAQTMAEAVQSHLLYPCHGMPGVQGAASEGMAITHTK